jgi:hypothetical protein
VVSIKSASGRVMSNLCFCIWWDMCHVVYSGVSGRETSMHYFSCLCGTDTYSTESAQGHVIQNLCSASHWICGSCS